MLSVEPNVELSLTTVRSWPEWKPSPTRLNGLSHPDILKSICLKSREQTFVALWWVSQINFSFRWLLGWMSSRKRRGSSRKKSRRGEGSTLRIMWNLTIKCLINNVIKWQSMLFLECFFFFWNLYFNEFALDL